MRKLLVLAMLCPFLSMCQPLTITGKIINEDGEPIVGATIAIRQYTGDQMPASGYQTQTNRDGAFTIPGLRLNDTLIVTATGYQPYFLLFDHNNRGTITITLTRKTALLDEAVVIAYGKTTRRLNTGSVSRLSAADISRQPVSNPLSTLEGRVPGLTIVQSSGAPGASVKVQLRGQNSIAQGSEPLFIIDGVPFAPNNQVINRLPSVLTTAAGTGLSPFNTINPADIQSIEILKDADATAIYGSRGANGVILITTKKGSTSALELDLNFSSGISTVTRTAPMLNTSQYLQMRREAFANDRANPTPNNAPDLLRWDTTRYTNFADLLLGGTAHSNRAGASLSGGTVTTRFRLNTTWHRETTVFPGSMANNKGNFHFYLSHNDPGQRFTLNLSTSYALDQNNLAASGLAALINLPPNTPPLLNPNGGLAWSENGGSFNNPLAYIKKSYEAKTNNLVSHLQLGYALPFGLTIGTGLGYNNMNVEEVLLNPIVSQNPSTSPRGSSLFGFSRFQSWLAEPQLNYKKQWQKTGLEALLGATFQHTGSNGYTIAAGGYSNDALLQSIAAAPDITSRSNSQNQYRYQAYFGRLTYNYDSRYILNLSGRRDASSRFGPGRQWASFGALGAAWIFASETSPSKLPFLSFGKIRASYGTTGNDQVGDYKYLDTWSAALPYNGATALYPTALFNPDYGWEINKKLECAIDLGFFSNRVLLSAAWFRNRSSNQLVEYVLPTQTGFFSIISNWPALVENRGWELELNSIIIKSNTLTWSMSANISFPKNELRSFPGLAGSSYANTYETGHPLSLIKKLDYTGVNPQTGIFSFRDVNQNGSIQVPSDFLTNGFVGPRWFGGLGNTITYKNMGLHAFIVFKKQWGSTYRASIYQPGFYPGTLNNQPVYVMDRWQHPGDETSIQKFTISSSSAAAREINRFRSSNGFYGDASFLRLKTIDLFWNLPALVLSKLKLSRLRIYLQAQNLFTLTSYEGSDPETQNLYAMPPLKTIMAGIQITL